MDDDGFTGGAQLAVEHTDEDKKLRLSIDEQLLTEPQRDHSPTTTERARLDLLDTRVSYLRLAGPRELRVAIGGHAGVSLSGDFGGSAAQSFIHEHAGGRLLVPDPNGSAGRNEQLQDTYLEARTLGLTGGLRAELDASIVGESLRATTAIELTVAPFATGLSSVKASSGLVLDPFIAFDPWLRPRAFASAELAGYATNNRNLTRNGWFDRTTALTPRLGVEIVADVAGRGAHAGLEVSSSPARVTEPIVSSYAGLTF
ncbi:MAG: hypothetical protein IT381_25985 [Deltaproteobacteria bacterium]|nr:hypothetical protein [Deltaproteobacteria bacterium]